MLTKKIEPRNLFQDKPRQWYPLVNIQKTIENGHLKWIYPATNWWIFPSFFCMFTRGYIPIKPILQLIFPLKNLHFHGHVPLNQDSGIQDDGAIDMGKNHPRGISCWFQLRILNTPFEQLPTFILVPSGYVKIAIENGHLQ